MTYPIDSGRLLRRLLTHVALVALLSGCAYLPHKPLVEGATSVTPQIPYQPANNGAIFQPGSTMNYGFQPMFEDRRPRNVGDTLTIVLQENVSASKSSSANSSHGGSTGLSFKTIPHFIEGLFGGDRANADISGKMNSRVKAVRLLEILSAVRSPSRSAMSSPTATCAWSEKSK